ncbi:MAG TPA: acylphosphatase [Methylocella sp.]|nr:acylphosphatase [Methylocella sp.]
MSSEGAIVRVIVSGVVQGVGYRAWMQIEASARGISGWVRNRSNGDVEALLAGPSDAVEALCSACWRGPSQASVSHVEVAEARASDLADSLGKGGFRQLATL